MSNDHIDGDDPIVVTSFRMHESIRREAKAYAALHGMTMQELVVKALAAYMKDTVQ